MPETLSIEAARAALGDIVDRARLAGEATTITRHGRAAARVTSLGVKAPANAPITWDAPRIIAWVRDEIAQLFTMSGERPLRHAWSSVQAQHSTAAGRAFEIRPWAQLGDALVEELGEEVLADGFELDDDAHAQVVKIAQFQVGALHHQIERYQWPTPTTGVPDLLDAAYELMELNGMIRFIKILTGQA